MASCFRPWHRGKCRSPSCRSPPTGRWGSSGPRCPQSRGIGRQARPGPRPQTSSDSQDIPRWSKMYSIILYRLSCCSSFFSDISVFQKIPIGLYLWISHRCQTYSMNILQWSCGFWRYKLRDRRQSRKKCIPASESTRVTSVGIWNARRKGRNRLSHCVPQSLRVFRLRFLCP